MAVRVNESMMDRVERAWRQHMYKMEETVVNNGRQQNLHRIYKVMGSTGNIYTVTFQPKQLTCDCHDFAFSHKGLGQYSGRVGGNPCKHIYFVHLRILKAAKDNPIIYTCAPSEIQLAELFEAAPVNAVDQYQASPAAQEAYRNAVAASHQTSSNKTKPQNETEDFFAFEVARRPFEGQDCPICLEPMEDASNDPMRVLIWCEKQCGQSCHRDCAMRWALQHGQTELNQTPCVWCRYTADNIGDSVKKSFQERSANIGGRNPDLDDAYIEATLPLGNDEPPIITMPRSGAFLNLGQYQPDLSANTHVARLIHLSDTQADDVMDLCTDEYVDDEEESNEPVSLNNANNMDVDKDEFGDIPYDTLVAAIGPFTEQPQEMDVGRKAKRKQDRRE